MRWVLAAALLLAGSAGAEPRSSWTHRAAVRLPHAPARGLVEFELTPEVHDLAGPDLRDLRLDSAERQNVAYVLRSERGAVRRASVDGRLYNAGYLAGKQSSVTADLGRSFLKNRVDIHTPGTDFRREVRVEASPDGLSWQTIRERAYLFRVAAGPGGAFDKRAVDLPDSDCRFLRVTVFNAPGDQAQTEITSVQAWRVETAPPEIRDVPLKRWQALESPRERCTDLMLDLGYRQLPLHRLRLTVQDANFFRSVTVSGRNCAGRVVRRPAEDGRSRDQVVEEPWSPITGGHIYRFTADGKAEESLELSLDGADFRWLLVRVDNGDNPPLTFTGAHATRFATWLAFAPTGTEPEHRLYFGNPEASRPAYDLPHYEARLRAEGVARADLGQAEENPLHVCRSATPAWTERHATGVLLALAATVAMIAWLVLRQARAASATNKRPPPNP
jgi:hypothetical protein